MIATVVRAKVQSRLRIEGTTWWVAKVYAEHYDGTTSHYKNLVTFDWREAIDAAHDMRRNLELDLMDEVHASRASRRDAAKTDPRSKHVKGCHLTSFTINPADCSCQYTMEPTS